MKLVIPSIEYETAFTYFYEDFLANDPENAGYYVEGIENFLNYVQR